jgi:hypothetical protein
MALALNLMIANLYVRFAVDGEETWDSNVRSLRAITGAQGLTLDIYPDRKPKVSILFIGFFIFFAYLQVDTLLKGSSPLVTAIRGYVFD